MYIKNKHILITIFLSFFLICYSYFKSELKASNELNIYSGRKSHLIEPLISEFEEKNKIKINLITGKSDEFIERLKLEKNNSQADILLTTDVARLTRAKNNNLFEKVNSSILKKNIPSKYISNDNDWFGLSIRARPIIFSKERVNSNELNSYKDLANQKWKNRVCMRSSNNVYNQSWIASMILNLGEQEAEKWIEDMVNNFAKKPYGGDRDQIKAIAYGECDVTVANTYYLANMMNSKNEKDKKAAQKVSIFWPNQETYGTHINLSGAGIIKGSKNYKNAVLFLEFLSSNNAQEIYTKNIHEYSINIDVKPSKTVSNFGKFKPDNLNIEEIGKKIKTAIVLASKHNWR
tara:strand:- start:3247 stop:4290 length:1044 start_codon:yes stop_codon:yes gene_type:complete